jgi:streptogramin lyase
VGRGGAIAGNPGPPAPGTGAHGIQTQDGKLWMAVPPSRMIYRIDPKTWTVEHMYPTVGYRPHGIGIEAPDARYLWESDTNMGAFFKRDMVTGEVVDSIQLPEGSPFPHGMSVWKGYIYWVDDVGAGLAPVCRVKI